MAAEIPQILKTHCKLGGGGWKEDELLEESGKKLRLDNNFDLDVFALVSWSTYVWTWSNSKASAQ